jgi:hypothetical protein
MNWNEHIIQALIEEGNDEQVVRTVGALLELEPRQVEERVNLHMQLGRRLLVLTVAKDESHEDVEAHVVRWIEQGRTLPDEQEDSLISEADKLFSAAFDQTSFPQSKSVAALHRSFVHAIRGAYDHALGMLELAHSCMPSPSLACWRRLILAQ